jgi:hypothetical protein
VVGFDEEHNNDHISLFNSELKLVASISLSSELQI